MTVMGKEAQLYRGVVVSLIADFGFGSAQFLAGHAPFAGLARHGKIRLLDADGNAVSLELPGRGFFHFFNNRAVLIL